MKSLGYSNKAKAKSNIVLRIANSLCLSRSDVCNHIDDSFTTTASKLVSKLPFSTNNFGIEIDIFKNYYLNKGIQPGAYKLVKITHKFVLEELSSINSQKATGMDNISPKFLKDSSLFISSALTHKSQSPSKW